MTDPDLQDLADLWTGVRRRRAGGVRGAWRARPACAGGSSPMLDFAAVAFILGVSVLELLRGARRRHHGRRHRADRHHLVIVTRKRRQIKQMTADARHQRAARPSSRPASATPTANLRRVRLSLAFFPLAVVMALDLQDGSPRRRPNRADMLGDLPGMGDRRRAASSPWPPRPARSPGASGRRGGSERELRRLEELRAAYAEEDRLRRERARLNPGLSLLFPLKYPQLNLSSGERLRAPPRLIGRGRVGTIAVAGESRDRRALPLRPPQPPKGSDDEDDRHQTSCPSSGRGSGSTARLRQQEVGGVFCAGVVILVFSADDLPGRSRAAVLPVAC